jgi:hypothetical protein
MYLVHAEDFVGVVDLVDALLERIVAKKSAVDVDFAIDAIRSK